MKQGGEGQVREEGEGDGAPAWGSPARVVACEDLAGEEGSRSLGSYLLDEGKDRARGPLLSCCTHGNEEARGSVVGAGTDAEEVTGEAGEDDGSCCLRTQRPWLSPVSENREREGKIVRTGGRVASGEKEQGCRGTHLRRGFGRRCRPDDEAGSRAMGSCGRSSGRGDRERSGDWWVWIGRDPEKECGGGTR